MKHASDAHVSHLSGLAARLVRSETQELAAFWEEDDLAFSRTTSPSKEPSAAEEEAARAAAQAATDAAAKAGTDAAAKAAAEAEAEAEVQMMVEVVEAVKMEHTEAAGHVEAVQAVPAAEVVADVSPPCTVTHPHVQSAADAPLRLAKCAAHP